MRLGPIFPILLVGLLGCKRLSTGARESFAKEYSCPEDRVVVTERSSLRYSSFFEPFDPGTPPDEVARDPGRLAKWNADKRADHEETMSGIDGDLTVFQVTGCDHEVFMGCGHSSTEDGGLDSGSVSCFTPPLGRRFMSR